MPQEDCFGRRSSQNRRIKRGALVALIGIDGAGKSTIAESLFRQLLIRGIDVEKKWCGFEDWVLFRPLFHKLRKALTTSHSSNEDGMREIGISSEHLLSNQFLRFLYYIMVTLDYSVQLSVRIALPKRRGKLVICDRYYFDQAISYSVELGSSRALTFFLRLYSVILPRPDLVVVVLVEPEIAMSRKHDIPSMKYLTDRLGIYQQLAASSKFELIDGEKNVWENVEKLCKMICQC